MNIEILNTFLVLSKTGSFTKTAHQLYIAQSTVTSRIKELEKELKQPLFIRDFEKIQLSHAGRRLLPYAEKMIHLHNVALLDLREQSMNTQILRIGCNYTIYNGFIHEKLELFLKDNKFKNKLHVKMELDSSKILIEKIASDVVDFCFTYIKFESPHIVCIPFYLDELLLVTSPKNPTFPDGITSDEILGLPLVFTGFCPGKNQAKYADFFPKHYTFFIEANHYSIQLSYLEKGLGYALLPKSNILPQLQKGLLTAISITDTPNIPLQTYFISKKKNLKNLVFDKWLSYMQLSEKLNDYMDDKFSP